MLNWKLKIQINRCNVARSQEALIVDEWYKTSLPKGTNDKRELK